MLDDCDALCLVDGDEDAAALDGLAAVQADVVDGAVVPAPAAADGVDGGLHGGVCVVQVEAACVWLVKRQVQRGLLDHAQRADLSVSDYVGLVGVADFAGCAGLPGAAA